MTENLEYGTSNAMNVALSRGNQSCQQTLHYKNNYLLLGLYDFIQDHLLEKVICWPWHIMPGSLH